MVYIELPWCSGGNLGEWAGQDGRTEWQRQAAARQLVSGVRYLHANGIVHRDLAARNILLTDSMVAKVSDFGLSRLLDTESAVYTKSATGPVKWMAPEQLTKRKATEKSDVWM